MQLINQKVSLKLETMIKYPSITRNAYSNYSKSLSDLHHYDFPPLELKEFWLRKSYFNPPNTLADNYAARSHIAGVNVPIVEVLHSDRRWLLLQTPKYSQGFFNHVNLGRISNPFQALLSIFKSFVELTKKYGNFVVTKKMIFLRKKEICVWISQDIFSN